MKIEPYSVLKLDMCGPDFFLGVCSIVPYAITQGHDSLMRP